MINEKSDKELLSLANAVGMSPSEFLTNHQSVLQVHILSDNLKWRDDSNVFQDCDDQESFGEVCPPKSISPSASSAGLQVNFILNWNSGLENLTIIVGFIAPQCGVHMLPPEAFHRFYCFLQNHHILDHFFSLFAKMTTRDSW